MCALLHDIGEVLSGTNHGEIAAAMLKKQQAFALVAAREQQQQPNFVLELQRLITFRCLLAPCPVIESTWSLFHRKLSRRQDSVVSLARLASLVLAD